MVFGLLCPTNPRVEMGLLGESGLSGQPALTGRERIRKAGVLSALLIDMSMQML